MNYNQGNFNLDADDSESGYEKWQEELDALKKEFEKRYGIILGSRVELTLRGEDKSLSGVITLCETKQSENRSQLSLRIASRVITLAEIESIMRL
jgi:hypothetical protein